MDQYLNYLQQLPQGVTNLSQLTKLAERRFGTRFHGTYASDQIPRLSPMQSCILNLDTSSGPGSHWIALVRGKGTQCYVYDSFGRRGVQLIPALAWHSPGKVIDSDLDPEQGVSESNCGARCIAWLEVFYQHGARIALTI